MTNSPDSATATRGSRSRRQPQPPSRQSPRTAADTADPDSDAAPESPSASPSRPRRTNARGSSASSVTTVKKEGAAKRGRRTRDSSPKNVQDEDENEIAETEDGDNDDGDGDGDNDGQSTKSGKGRGRPPRSRNARNGASQRAAKQDQPEEVEGEDDEAESMSIDKDDTASKADTEEDDEEIEGEIEEAGEAKITKNGELLGGREYKCRSFTMPTRGDRIYMLSMDPARVLGFRDSYLFFLKNPQLVRVNTTADERAWMIERGMLMPNFKSKLIAVVTARSIFKSFGHRIIKKGRSRVDDYYESRAIEEDTAVDSDDDTASKADEAGGSQNINGITNALEDSQTASLGKRKHTLLQTEESTRQVTDLNWLYESALAVRALNTQLKDLRKENPKFSDPHTNIEQVPASSQPTHCETTAVPSKSEKQDNKKAPATNAIIATVISIPRSVGPQVDTAVKVEIKGGAPAPPAIQDPRIWAVIPDDIRKALEAADVSKTKGEENDDLSKFPLSLSEGQFQASFPIHQARFQQPYRVVLPQSMTQHAQYLHYLHSVQTRGETGLIMEQTTLPGQMSAHDVRLLQWQQQQQQQQQQQLQQQHQQQLAKLQQQQQELQAAAVKKAETLTPPTGGITCGALLKTGLGYCQRLVSAQGEHCPNHRGPNASHSGTSVANDKDSICSECNSATAPPGALPTDKPLPCAMTHLNKCKTCSKSFHPLCLQLDTPRIVSAIASYPWQCNDCKLCVVCLEAGDEASLLICDDCDRGWHMSCCNPAIKEVPQGDGGEDDGQSDAVGEDDNNMVCCDECNRWVHMDCDSQLTEDKVDEMSKDESLKYTCPPCALKVAPIRPGPGSPPNVALAHQDVVLQSLRGQIPPQPKVCGHLGGKMRVRGLVEHQGKKLGVPEVVGAGVEYDRKMVSELTALKNRNVAKRKKSRPSTKSPVRRASIASSTSSSLSSLSGSVDS
ncbi:hypothetical protein BGZ51_000788 [Haplosporangium sp. Z 767]|nr:hypothetical protein BGZ51_000788 [Haplosporangium sp. Z 767]